MANKKPNNSITVDEEVIDINTLSEESRMYLDHLMDLDKQVQDLNFKLQQVRTAKTAFLSMFNNSRLNKKE
jgi:transposase-like protein